MNAYAIHTTYELRNGIRNRSLLLMNYLFPLGFYLMMGAIMPGINPLFRETMVPAMVTFAVLAATLLGLPDPLVSAREAGIFRSYKINGVPALNILTIPALTTALHLTVVSILICITAPLIFDAAVPTSWPLFGFVFAAAALACTGLGVLIGVIAPSTRLTVIYSQIVFIPSMILGGMMLPFDMLPAAAQLVAKLLPATQAMNGFNALAMGLPAVFNPWISVAALAASGIIAFGLALWLFRWDSHGNGRRRPAALALLVFVPYALTWLV